MTRAISSCDKRFKSNCKQISDHSRFRRTFYADGKLLTLSNAAFCSSSWFNNAFCVSICCQCQRKAQKHEKHYRRSGVKARVLLCTDQHWSLLYVVAPLLMCLHRAKILQIRRASTLEERPPMSYYFQIQSSLLITISTQVTLPYTQLSMALPLLTNRH